MGGYSSPPSEKIVHRKNIAKSRIRFEYFLSLLVRRGAIEYKNYDGSQFVNLCASFLDDILEDYKHRFDYLIQLGILESDNEHEPKVKCKGYRFTSKFQKVGFEVSFHDDVKFKKQISKSRVKHQAKTFKHLYDKFALLDVDYDLGAALVNEDLKTNNIVNLGNTFGHLKGIKSPCLMTWTLGETGRLYTPITSIKKKYRNILKYNGEYLLGYDIGNSIPFISTILFKEDIIESSINIINRIYKSNPKIKKDNSLILREIYTEDALSYKELVEANSFYEHISQEWKKEHGINFTRKQAKDKFLECIFKPKKMECKFSKTFANRFPHVYEVFQNINFGFSRTRNGKGLNKRKIDDMDCPLAKLLQGIEAYLILQLICGNLSKKYPHMPLFTVHDCIATTEPYLEILHQEILSVFATEIGVVPPLKLIANWELD